MIAACSLLTIIGLSDMLHSRDLSVPSPETANRSAFPLGNLRRATMAAVTVTLIVLTALSSPWWATVGVAIGTALWLLTYRAQTQAIGTVTAALVVIALISPVVSAQLFPTRFSQSWAADSDFWLGYQWLLAAAAVLLINMTTANRIVRMVLHLAGTTFQVPATVASPPRAGRIIGILERYLLIILIVAGQGLSIAGIAAAKSIIRYPEISKSAREAGGLSAEVFFIGTVTSWLLALASTGVVLLAF